MLTDRYPKAVAFAAEVHAGDKRTDTEIPYLSHVLAVSAMVLEDGGSENEAIGALLHDVAEDHGGEEALATIEREFGAEVAAIVRACSDSLLPEGERKEAWRPRKERYLDHLRGAAPEALRVSNADKLHNARAILADLARHGDRLWSRFNAGPDEQLWYYSSLAEVFSEKRQSSRLASELVRVVEEIEATVRASGGSASVTARA